LFCLSRIEFLKKSSIISPLGDINVSLNVVELFTECFLFLQASLITVTIKILRHRVTIKSMYISACFMGCISKQDESIDFAMVLGKFGE
jgi:hypothetical protein